MKAIVSIAKSAVVAFKYNPRYLIVLAAVLMPMSVFYYMAQIIAAKQEVVITFAVVAVAVLAYTAWIVNQVLGHQERV